MAKRLTKKLKTHFVYEGYEGPDYFCDRTEETEKLIANMSLDVLHKETYYDFTLRFFKDKCGDFSSDVFQQLYNQFWGYTWYLQSLLNSLYEQNKQVTDEEQLKEALHTILADKANQYEMLLSFLSDNQRRLLLAIAAEG